MTLEWMNESRSGSRVSVAIGKEVTAGAKRKSLVFPVCVFSLPSGHCNGTCSHLGLCRL